MGFDPKAYLAKKQAEQSAQPAEFDPKAYLASKQVQSAAPEKSFTERFMSEGMFAPGKGQARSEALARGELPSDIPMAANIPMTAGSGVVPKAANGLIGLAKASGMEGALQGAGGSMREDSLGSRVAHTALGTGLGTIAGGVAGLISKGAQASKDARLFSKPYEAAKWAQGQFDDSLTKLQELIRGKTDIVEQGVKGKPITANLEQIRKAAPDLGEHIDDIYPRSQPNYEKDILPGSQYKINEVPDSVIPGNVENIPGTPSRTIEYTPDQNMVANPYKAVTGGPDYIPAETAPSPRTFEVPGSAPQSIQAPDTVVPGGRQVLPNQPVTQLKQNGNILQGQDALSLKRALDDENWKVAGSMDPIHKAKNEELANLAEGLRTQINNVSPEVGQANELMSQRALPLKKLLEAKDTAESPMSRLLSENAAPTLANADDLLGTGLGEAAHRMDTAKWLQLDPRKLLTLSALPEMAKTAGRGAGLAAEGVSRMAPEGSKDAILAAALAATAPKQKRK